VKAQRGGSAVRADADAELDPAALQQVQQECWPEPRSAAELHEALGWMGWLDDAKWLPRGAVARRARRRRPCATRRRPAGSPPKHRARRSTPGAGASKR
jgi:hypothetical protein